MDEKDRADFQRNLQSFGAPEETPKELEASLLFGQLTLEWTPESRSFLSTGNIGIAAVGDRFVNSSAEGYFELQRKRNGDEIYLYLDLSGSEELYMDYRRNMMGIYTTNETFMDALKALELKDRRNEEKGLPPFTYTISTKGKLNRFIRRFEMFEE
jgi:hypothetical protein